MNLYPQMIACRQSNIITRHVGKTIGIYLVQGINTILSYYTVVFLDQPHPSMFKFPLLCCVMLSFLWTKGLHYLGVRSLFSSPGSIYERVFPGLASAPETGS